MYFYIKALSTLSTMAILAHKEYSQLGVGRNMTTLLNSQPLPEDSTSDNMPEVPEVPEDSTPFDTIGLGYTQSDYHENVLQFLWDDYNAWQSFTPLKIALTRHAYNPNRILDSHRYFSDTTVENKATSIANEIQDNEDKIKKELSSQRTIVQSGMVEILDHKLRKILRKAKQLRPTKKRIRHIHCGDAKTKHANERVNELWECVYDTIMISHNGDGRLSFDTVSIHDTKTEIVTYKLGHMPCKTEMLGKWSISVPLTMLDQIISLANHEQRITMALNDDHTALTLSQESDAPRWKSTVKASPDHQMIMRYFDDLDIIEGSID